MSKLAPPQKFGAGYAYGRTMKINDGIWNMLLIPRRLLCIYGGPAVTLLSGLFLENHEF